MNAFGTARPRSLAFEQTGGSPRPRRGSPRRVEGDGAAATAGDGDRPGELERKGGARVHQTALRPGALSKQLPELPASARLRPASSHETADQSRRGQTGGVRPSLRRGAPGSEANGRVDLVRGRGVLSRRRRPARALGAQRKASAGRFEQSDLERRWASRCRRSRKKSRRWSIRAVRA